MKKVNRKQICPKFHRDEIINLQKNLLKYIQEQCRPTLFGRKQIIEERKKLTCKEGDNILYLMELIWEEIELEYICIK